MKHTIIRGLILTLLFLAFIVCMNMLYIEARHDQFYESEATRAGCRYLGHLDFKEEIAFFNCNGNLVHQLDPLP